MESAILFQSLCHAIRVNDSKTVREVLLKNPQWLNQLDTINFALQQATIWDFEKELLEILINLGTSVNYGVLLRFVVSRGKVQLAESLLQKGAKTDDVLDRTSDSVARRVFKNIESRKAMLQLFIQYGLDFRVRNNLGDNILHQFLTYHVKQYSQDAVEIAEILINSGVPEDEPDHNGSSPLYRSIVKHNIELVSFFIKRRSAIDTSHLLKAVELDNQQIIELLLSSGADVNAKTEFGWTALHIACLSRNDQVINLLVHRGADVSVKNKAGLTPFSLLEPSHWNDLYVHRTRCIIIFMKEFAKLSFGSHSVSECDIDLIHKNKNTRELFEQIQKELRQTKSTRFYEPYSYYSVITMSRDLKKLANLTKNSHFVLNFTERIHEFSYFKNDLQRIFGEAIQLRDKLSIIRSRLYSTFGDVFPDVVIRNLTLYFRLEDLPMQS